MRATELFVIFAFVKSLEQFYLSPEYTPSFLGSGVSVSSWPPALFNTMSYSDFTPSFIGSGFVSMPSWPPALFNIIPYGLDTHVEVPVVPIPVAPVQVNSPVNKIPTINAPTCIFYISQMVRPRFSPAPVIPPCPQPTCLNRHIHPTFEVPGPKSPWIIPSPFPLPSKSVLPEPPFCLPSDKTDLENNNDNDNDESIWLSIFLSPTVLATIWHFCRLLARRPIRSSASRPGSLDNHSMDPMPLSLPNLVIPKRKRVECRERVTQPRVSIFTLPSLPAGSDAFVIIPQRPIECNASATVSTPVLPSVSKTEISSTPPDHTETTVEDLPLEITSPIIDQDERITPCALSPVLSSPAEPPSKESAPQPSLSCLPTPTLPISLLASLGFEESQCCWVPKSESAPVATFDAIESSPSLPACDSIIDASAASLPSPMPTPVKKPAKKKPAPTQQLKPSSVSKTEPPTVEIATADLSIVEMQESFSKSSTATVETLPNLICDPTRVSEAAETSPGNDVAPTARSDLYNFEVQVQDSGVLKSIETESEASTPASLSDSISTLKPSEIITEEDAAPLVTPPPSEKASSGSQGSTWTAAPDVPVSSQLTHEALETSVSTLLPVEKKRVCTKRPKNLLIRPTQYTAMIEISPVDEVSPTTILESHSESSSSLSTSILALEATEAPCPPSVDELSPPTTTENHSESSSSSLSESIWASEPTCPPVVDEVPLPATSVETRSGSSSSLSESIWASEPTCPPPVDEVSLLKTNVETHSESSSSLFKSIWASEPTCLPPVDEVSLPTTIVETRPGSSSSSVWAFESTEATCPPPIDDLSPPTTIVETHLESSFSLSESIWASEPTCPFTVKVPSTTIVETHSESSSSLSESIWASEPTCPPPVDEVSPLKTSIETHSESSSSLSKSIWASEPTCLPPVDEVSLPTTIVETRPGSSSPSIRAFESTGATCPPPVDEVSLLTTIVETHSESSPSLSASIGVSEPTCPPHVDEVSLPTISVETRSGSSSSLSESIWAFETTCPSIVDVTPTTTIVETYSESSSSLSESIWISEPTEATSVNIVPPTPLLAEDVTGLQSSIWATMADIPKVVALPVTSSTPPPRVTTPDVPKIVTPTMTLPTPPPSAKKLSGIKTSIWTDDTSAIVTSYTPAPICEEDLLAFEQRNLSVSASQWANAPDTTSTPRLSKGKVNASRSKGRRGRSSCA